jgi:SMI1/KNR4 family protein SUKH-1
MRDGIWRPEPPADEKALAALREQAGIRLPAAYLEQLAASNGGEGDLGVDPGWISFWPAETVVTSNVDYAVAEFLPGFFGFASNGGGELLAFDVRGGEPYSIVMVPFVPMDIEHAVPIASSFDELRNLIGAACDDGSGLDEG